MTRKSKQNLRIKKPHSLQWILDLLENHPDLLQKRMFGCLAAYLRNRIVLVLADKEEPWNGILIPTEREFHPSIEREFPSLQPHPILGKWLYLSQSHPEFEEISTHIVKHILSEDPRYGVVPKGKKVKMSR